MSRVDETEEFGATPTPQNADRRKNCLANELMQGFESEMLYDQYERQMRRNSDSREGSPRGFYYGGVASSVSGGGIPENSYRDILLDDSQRLKT
jgi:hypothetical protein